MSTVVNALQFGWRSRRAWWFTASARTRERFARTTLGSFWLGLSNLLSVAVLSLVYGTVFRVPDFNSYVVYLGTGMVIWNTIAGSLQSAPILLKGNARNIKNSNKHPIFYSLEEWSFQVQTFLQSFGLVVVVLSLFQHTLIRHLLTAGLLPLLNLLLLIYWLPLLVCLLGARYEDFFQLIPIALQLLFLVSPILYSKDALGKMAWTAEFNPLYRILSALRQALIEGQINLGQGIIVLLVNVCGVYFSLWLLERQRPYLPFWI
jgi:lipopolysaccharide transport system permease protein